MKRHWHRWWGVYLFGAAVGATLHWALTWAIEATS